MSAERLITEHLDLWTSAVTYNRDKPELTGIAKLRELILELAVRGKLVPQDSEDEPASKLLERIEEEKEQLYKEGEIKKPRKVPEIAEDEKPFDLPTGWAWVRFGEVAYPQAGFAFKSREFNYSGDGLPLIRIRDVGQTFSGTYYNGEYREEFVVENGDYLVSMDGVFRVARWNGGKALLNQRVTRLIFFSEDLTQRFFAENLQFQLEKLQGVKAYTTVDHLAGKQIGESVVALPPAEEQQRIVQKLDDLMALCDRLDKQTSDQISAHETLVDTLLETLTRSQDAAELAENWARLAGHFDTLFTTEHSVDRLEQTILQIAVTGRLVPQDPDDEPASKLLERIEGEKKRLYKKGEIKKPMQLREIEEEEKSFEAPNGWQWVRMGEIQRFFNGLAFRSGDFTDEGIGVVRIGDVSWYGRIIPKEMKRLPPEKAKTIEDKFWVLPGDLVITMTGDVKVGFNREEEDFLLNQRVGKIVTYIVDSRYVFRFLQTVAKEKIDNAFGGVIPNVSTKEINNTPICLPPLSEQCRIVEEVDELTALCKNLKDRVNEAGKSQQRLADSLVNRAVAQALSVKSA